MVCCIFLSLFLNIAENFIIQTETILYQFMPPLRFQVLILEKKFQRCFLFILDLRMQTGLTSMQNTASQLSITQHKINCSSKLKITFSFSIFSCENILTSWYQGLQLLHLLFLWGIIFSHWKI